MPIMSISGGEVTGIASLAGVVVVLQHGFLIYFVKTANDREAQLRNTVDKATEAMHAAVDALKEVSRR